jgi:hypothetical protein
VFSRHRIRIRLVFDHLPLASTANVAEGAVRQRRRDGAAETGRQWIVTSVWFPWHGRDLGHQVKVFGHCDAAPWNIVARDGLPVALIDWETAGPVDPLVELAQLAWLNAKLHDDIVARREHLPPLADRARQLAAIVDGYGLTARQRRGFLSQIIEFAICDTAFEADDAAITPETTAHPVAPWAMAWRARSAAWMIRHRRTLETALTRGMS